MAVLVPMAAGAQEPYAVLSNGNSVLTFYYDDQKAARNGMDVGPFDYSKNVYQSWDGQRGSITSVVFDASFANCTTLTSTAYWFYGLKNLSSITGIGNLKTGNVTDMREMFEYCRSLTSLDLSGFRTDNVTGMGWMFGDCSGLTSLNLTGFKTDYVSRMDYMFSGCSGLTTIYAGDGWSTAKVTYGEGMFSGCTSLVGGTGTPYDASHIDYTYAQIDGGSDNPGYFTRKGGSGEWPEGDLNHDGKVDASDVVTLVNMIISRK